MTIREIMTRTPKTVLSTDALGNAQQEMSQLHIHHLPVMSDGKVVGMLSERDLLEMRAHAEPDDRWWKQPVALAMQPPEMVEAGDDVVVAASRLSHTQLGAVAVLDRGSLVGIVSVADLLAAQAAGARTMPGRTAHDAMRASDASVCPEEALLAAVKKMCDLSVRELPVVDETGRVVGMLTEADIRRRVGDPSVYLASHSRGPIDDVQDIMDTTITLIHDDRPLLEIAHNFCDCRLEALPVVNASGALVGVLTFLDALEALAA